MPATGDALPRIRRASHSRPRPSGATGASAPSPGPRPLVSSRRPAPRPSLLADRPGPRRGHCRIAWRGDDRRRHRPVGPRHPSCRGPPTGVSSLRPAMGCRWWAAAPSCCPMAASPGSSGRASRCSASASATWSTCHRSSPRRSLPRPDVPRVVALTVALGQGLYAFAPAAFGLLRERCPSARAGDAPAVHAIAAAVFTAAIVTLLLGRRAHQ